VNLATEAPNGVLNYTTVFIPENVTVRFSANPSNTPVFLAATGDIIIEGTIELYADTLEISSNAVITAKGGDAGAVSTVHHLNASGENGSIGYLTAVASTYQISPHATIEYTRTLQCNIADTGIGWTGILPPL